MASRRGHVTRSDEELVTASRDGDTAAFAELWERHSAAATSFVRHYSSSVEADDVVAEAYTRILAALQGGNGPTDGFRPYLYAALRNLVKSWGTREKPLSVEDLDATAAPEGARFEAALERSIMVRAFRSLPDRWRYVLWYTEVEGLDPHEVAPLFGVSPSGAASLAHRARRGLRDAWVQAHISDRERPEACRRTVERLGRRAGAALTESEANRVEEHLAGCVACAAVAAEVDDISSRLALVLVPLMVGAGALGAIEAMRGGTDVASTASAASASEPSGADASIGDGGAGGAAAPDGGASSLVSKVFARVTSHTGRAVAVAAGSATAVGVAAVVVVAAVSGAPPAEPLTPPVVAAPERVVTPESETRAQGELASEAPEPPPSSDDDAGPSTPPRDPHPPSAPEAEKGTGANSGTVVAPLSAPVAVLTIPSDPRRRPALTGTGEPGATVQVVDQRGTQLARLVVGPEGSWSTGELTALEPTVTGLVVRQTRGDGTVSPPKNLGPFTFAPTVVVAPGNETLSDAAPNLHVSMVGWAGSELEAVFRATGATVPNWPGAAHVIVLGSESPWVIGPFAPGTYAVTLRYLDSNGTPGPESAPVAFTRLP